MKAHTTYNSMLFSQSPKEVGYLRSLHASCVTCRFHIRMQKVTPADMISQWCSVQMMQNWTHLPNFSSMIGFWVALRGQEFYASFSSLCQWYIWIDWVVFKLSWQSTSFFTHKVVGFSPRHTHTHTHLRFVHKCNVWLIWIQFVLSGLTSNTGLVVMFVTSALTGGRVQSYFRW